MEILLTLAFVVVVIVGTKLYKKRVAHMSPKTESKAVRGGAPYTSTSQDNTTIKENTEF